MCNESYLPMAPNLSEEQQVIIVINFFDANTPKGAAYLLCPYNSLHRHVLQEHRRNET